MIHLTKLILGWDTKERATTRRSTKYAQSEKYANIEDFSIFRTH